MDTYQPIYDAVRSALRNTDVGSAVQEALRCDIDHQARCAFQEISAAGSEMQRPSVLWRPELSVDGDQWCALYGSDLQNGVAGFGDSPDEAMHAFDEAWFKSLNKETK